MSEPDFNDANRSERQEWVEMTCARGTVLNRDGHEVQNLAPGDTFEAPVTRHEAGVFPVAWWEQNKKAFRDPDTALRFADAYVAHATSMSAEAVDQDDDD